MRSIRFIPFIIFLFPTLLSAQNSEKSWTLNGYVSDMQTVMFQNIGEDWITENLIHNRLNFHWYPFENLTATVQFRNRLIYGETIKGNQDYIDAIGKNDGWADLSFNLSSGNSYVLNSAIDRIWIQYTDGNFVATAGRQRINWGQTLVWNPNDLFNVYSYFDVDYIERPGSDALRLQYYPGYTSTIELAAKIDSSNKVTAAGLFRFNLHGYDIQFLGGMLGGKDYVAGLGWSGNLWNAAFRGEASYFHDIDNSKDTTGVFMASAGMDYTFENSLMLQFEFLYANEPYFPPGGFLAYHNAPLNVKSLAFTEYSAFAGISYPITPLFQGSLAGMYFPKLKGFFAGPSFTYNMMDNLDLSLITQYFTGEIEDQRMDVILVFLRLKWNF